VAIIVSAVIVVFLVKIVEDVICSKVYIFSISFIILGVDLNPHGCVSTHPFDYCFLLTLQNPTTARLSTIAHPHTPRRRLETL
jgi:hypothetical protein